MQKNTLTVAALSLLLVGMATSCQKTARWYHLKKHLFSFIRLMEKKTIGSNN